MNHFQKTVCVVDTCSIIYLDDINLGRNSILKYLRTDFNVFVSESIKKEFIKHKAKLNSREATYWQRFLSKKEYLPEVTKDDLKCLGPFYDSIHHSFGEKVAGEREIAKVSIELLFTKKAGHVVFITDDIKAQNAFLSSIGSVFPGFKLWTSKDVIYYLGGILLKEKKVIYNDVWGALRDVNIKWKNWRNMSDADRNKLIKSFAKSKKDLKKIKTISELWS